MGPDTDALLVGLICGPADLWPDPGSKPIMLSMACNSVLQVATPGPVPGKNRRETKPQKLPPGLQEGLNRALVGHYADVDTPAVVRTTMEIRITTAPNTRTFEGAWSGPPLGEVSHD